MKTRFSPNILTSSIVARSVVVRQRKTTEGSLHFSTIDLRVLNTQFSSTPFAARRLRVRLIYFNDFVV